MPSMDKTSQHEHLNNVTIQKQVQLVQNQLHYNFDTVYKNKHKIVTHLIQPVTAMNDIQSSENAITYYYMFI